MELWFFGNGDDIQLTYIYSQFKAYILLSALYSYSDWHKLKVRDMDPSFVYEVLTEGVKILNNCELYSKYQDERNARFKVTPRKVTEVLCEVLLVIVQCICVMFYWLLWSTFVMCNPWIVTTVSLFCKFCISDNTMTCTRAVVCGLYYLRVMMIVSHVLQMQQLVHLMLNDPVDTKKDIEVLIEGPSKPSVTVEKFRLRNPYTVEFRMPGKWNLWL